MPIYLNNKKIGDLILTVESSSSTTHDATISSSNQLMAGVTAYGPMGKITGTMPVVTVPDPTLTVRNDGLVTVTLGAISAGYLNATSAKQATRQLDVIGATTYTPGTTAQTIASGKYLTGVQTIAGDANLVAANIKEGVQIFGVTGTHSGGTNLQLQNKSVSFTPSETEIVQTVVPDSGYDGMDELEVTIGAISSTYVGSGITRRNSSSLTASGATVTVPAGYYSAQATKSVASGTAGTPTASKGTVSNNSISVTPSVTNTTGYITGGTKNGTAVTVSASELVSGKKEITSNGDDIDVTNYASVKIAVPTGSTILNQNKTVTPTKSQQSVTFDSGYTGLGTVTVNSIPSQYIVPAGTYEINENGEYDITQYASVDVDIDTVNNQSSKTITPTESRQYVTPDSQYTGLDQVIVEPIANDYIGSAIDERTSADLTASGATVTVPAGYYPAQATKAVNTMTLPASAAASATSGYTSAATISRSTSDQYINIPTGYNTAGAYYKVNAVPNGSVTAPSTIFGSSATVGVNSSAGTISLSKVVSVTPTVTTAGYISSGTAGDSTVTLNTSATYKAASTYTPTTTDQTIFSTGLHYFSGIQKIAGDADLVAGNIKSGITIFGVEGTYTGAGSTIESLTVTPTTSQQVFDSSSVDGYKPVTINAIPNASANPSLDLVNYTTSGNNYVLQGTNNDPAVPFYSTDGQARIVLPKAIMGNAIAEQVLSGATFTSANGVAISGAMDNNGTLNGTINTQGGTYTIPAGYTSGGTVTANITAGSLTNTIINGTSFEETSGDYGFRTTVNIPAGYYNATQLTKEFSTILPAPDTEGTSSQVLIGYDLYNHEGQVISGTMSNNGTWNRTLDQTTTSVTIPEGYHSGSGTVSHTTVNIPDPTITVSNSGLITASGSWTRGFTTDNSYSNTQQLTTQAAKTVTPTESEQTAVASGVYTTGTVKVGAISSTYVGSDITSRSSSDLTVSGATVTAPAGYYSTAASKSVATMTLPTSASSSATSGATNKATIGRSTSAQYINIPVGYNSTASYYTISAVANGSATNSGTASGSSATVSTGTNTITLSKAVSITPTVNAGYISNGTAGNVTVSLTANVTTKGTATITPGTTNQTISSGTYITGTQTIAGDADLIASNIRSGVQIFNVTGTYSGLDTSDATATVEDIMEGETAYVDGHKLTGTLVLQTYYTGSGQPSSSLGNNGDIYLQS